MKFRVSRKLSRIFQEDSRIDIKCLGRYFEVHGSLLDINTVCGKHRFLEHWGVFSTMIGDDLQCRVLSFEFCVLDVVCVAQT